MADDAGDARIERADDGCVTLGGELTVKSVGALWIAAERLLANGVNRLDASGVTGCDHAGLALLHWMARHSGATVDGLPADCQHMYDRFAGHDAPPAGARPSVSRRPLTTLGRGMTRVLASCRELFVFGGRLLVGLALALSRPRALRPRYVLATLVRVGADALPIVALIGFLTGVIMAFQAAQPMRQFGADIFVVDMVAIAMLRELGVLMTAIIFAGRSGAAFAAELGTMKVNEELDALRTMGLDPLRLLVVPMVVAGTLATPLLTVYANIIGVGGGLLVVMLLGHPWGAIQTQLAAAVQLNDILSGLLKSLAFGFAVSAIGCLRGLQTGSGAASVGNSTTRAVVSGIVLIVLLDGLFAVVFYALEF